MSINPTTDTCITVTISLPAYWITLLGPPDFRGFAFKDALVEPVKQKLQNENFIVAKTEQEVSNLTNAKAQST